MKTKLRKLRYWVPAAFWLAIMFIMSSVSIEPEGKRNLIGYIVQSLKQFLISSSVGIIHFIGLYTDKIYHGFEYAVFTLLFYYAMQRTYSFSTAKKVTLISISSIVIAAVDELHQRLTPSRIPQLSDFAADLTGVIIVLLIILAVRLLRRRNELQEN